MRRILTLSLTLLAASSLYAGEPCGCCDDCCSADRWHFRIVRCEEKCKTDVDAHKWYATTSKVVCEQQLPCGTQTKTTVTDIIPIDTCSKKTVEKVKVCTTVYLECRPVMDVHRVDAGAPK
jgi:hypothetical protein